MDKSESRESIIKEEANKTVPHTFLDVVKVFSGSPIVVTTPDEELKEINNEVKKLSEKSETLGETLGETVADELKNNEVAKTYQKTIEQITSEKNILLKNINENETKIQALSVEIEALRSEKSSTNDKVNDKVNLEEVLIVNDKGRKFYYKVVCTLFLVFVSIPALLFSYLLNSVLQSNNLSLFKTKVEIVSKIKLYNSLLFLFSVVLMIIFCMLLWFTKLELLIVVFISFFYLLLCGVYLVLYLEIKKLSSDLGQSNVYLNFMMYIIPMMLSTFLLSVGQIALYGRYNN
jgi:hypothetical protein